MPDDSLKDEDGIVLIIRILQRIMKRVKFSFLFNGVPGYNFWSEEDSSLYVISKKISLVAMKLGEDCFYWREQVSVTALPIGGADAIGVLCCLTDDGTVLTDEEIETVSLFGKVISEELIQAKISSHFHEEMNHYLRLIDSLDQVIFEADLEGRLIFLNESGVKKFGYTKETLIGKSVIDFIHPKHHERVKETLANLLSGRLSRTENRYSVRRFDDTYFSAIISSFLVESPKKMIRGVIIDNSVQDQMNRHIVEVNKKLNLANSIVRHDINNCLSVVRGCIDLIIEEDCDGRFVQPVKILSSVTDKASMLIQGAKTYQEIGINEPQWILLDNLFEHCSDSHPGIVFFNELKGVKVLANPLFKKAVYNLVENTIRHGKRASKVWVFCRKKEGGRLVIYYVDDGVGVPMEQKESIFEYGSGVNTGWGLFLIREILSMTDMMIREIGKPGEGAIFEIVVPKGRYELCDHS